MKKIGISMLFFLLGIVGTVSAKEVQIYFYTNGGKAASSNIEVSDGIVALKSTGDYYASYNDTDTIKAINSINNQTFTLGKEGTKLVSGNEWYTFDKNYKIYYFSQSKQYKIKDILKTLGKTNDSKPMIDMYANWEGEQTKTPHTVTIKYHANGGKLETKSKSITIKNSYILCSETIDCIKKKSTDYVGSKNGLSNYNNKNYINITKNGYRAKKGMEWNTKSDGTGKSYSQDVLTYKMSDFCDASKKDCSVTLYVNWEEEKKTKWGITEEEISEIESGKRKITYELFGAKGDGKTDDIEAIKAAHNFANDEYVNKGNFMTVYATKGKKYYISTGKQSSDITVKVATNTDWQGASFIIDDYKDKNKDGINDIDCTKSIFRIVSPMEISTNSNHLTFKDENSDLLKKIRTIKATDNLSFPVKGLKDLILNYYPKHKEQKAFFNASSKWAIMVTSPESIYVRTGNNANDGQQKYEMMIFDTKTENIEGGVIYNLENVTKIEAFPIPERKITIKNANFTTYTNNQVYTPKGEKTEYTRRNIKISYTGNVEITGINHYLNESKYKSIVSKKYQSNVEGNKYRGFVLPDHSAFVKISKSNFQPHQYVNKINTLGTKVGTYDMSFSASEYIFYDKIGYSCNLSNTTACYNKYILNSDKNRWGIMGSNNNNKNVFITNSKLNRIDDHTGIYNLYVSDTKIGDLGINLAGNGKMYGNNLTFDRSIGIIKLREDYGSIWNGDIILNNITYIQESSTNPIIRYYNSGQDYYGYLSTFPNLYINDFKIDSSKTGSNNNYLNIIQKIKNEPLKKPKNKNTAYYFKENMYIKNIRYIKGTGTISVFDSELASTKNASNLNKNNYGGNTITKIYISPDSTVKRSSTKEANDNLKGNKLNTKFTINFNTNIDNIMSNKIKETTDYFNKLKEMGTFKSTK